MALPADFSKIYGSTATGGLTPINDVDYSKGWEFVGSNPPTKNDFSYLQNLSDLKSQWLYSNKLQRTDPFGDIKADGAAAIATALANLGLKTAAVRDVGTGANQIPDMASFTSGDGWFRLPSGHIVQYGSVAVANPNAGAFTNSANFKIPFVSEIYGVLAIPQTTASVLGLNPIFIVTAKTLTNFTIRADLNDVTSGSKFSIGQSYFYLALGK